MVGHVPFSPTPTKSPKKILHKTTYCDVPVLVSPSVKSRDKPHLLLSWAVGFNPNVQNEGLTATYQLVKLWPSQRQSQVRTRIQVSVNSVGLQQATFKLYLPKRTTPPKEPTSSCLAVPRVQLRLRHKSWKKRSWTELILSTSRGGWQRNDRLGTLRACSQSIWRSGTLSDISIIYLILPKILGPRNLFISTSTATGHQNLTVAVGLPGHQWIGSGNHIWFCIYIYIYCI